MFWKHLEAISDKYAHLILAPTMLVLISSQTEKIHELKTDIGSSLHFKTDMCQSYTQSRGDINVKSLRERMENP